VLVSTTFSRDGWYPEIVSGMTQMGAGAAEPMKQRRCISFMPASRRNQKIGQC
jgi:hypothetical protein